VKFSLNPILALCAPLRPSAHLKALTAGRAHLNSFSLTAQPRAHPVSSLIPRTIPARFLRTQPVPPDPARLDDRMLAVTVLQVVDSLV
jgi:hypothetical protein